MRLLIDEVGLESGPFPPHPFFKRMQPEGGFWRVTAVWAYVWAAARWQRADSFQQRTRDAG